jgi:21S rRNA (uridine2791-2'-O)-methyltransferase
MALTTARFEREYDQVHARTVQLLDAERGRMHCMEQLLLRIENENLQLQMDQTSQELIQARKAESGARLQLDGVFKELELLQGIAQTSSRELEHLRVRSAHTIPFKMLYLTLFCSVRLHH